MRKIIYYVATSLDGYISGVNDDISMFKLEGEGIDQYQYDLLSFDTVIMGRNTYEFGYVYGMKPGDRAYPHMEHLIYSNSLSFEEPSKGVRVIPRRIEQVQELKNEIGSDIYLCGGGTFAGWLMVHGMIDELRLKVNPVLIGNGIKLFGNYQVANRLEVLYNQSFDDGLQIITYRVVNS